MTSLSSSLNGAPAATSGLAYDNAGNTTLIANADGLRTLFTYDDADRLSRIEWRDAGNAPLSKSEFVYDYASRKAISQEFTYTAGAWQQRGETRRVFDGLDVIQERNAQNEVTAQLVRDGNIGGILSRSTAVGASFYAYDGGGNVTLLTDEQGNDVGRYRYDAFGNTLEAVGARAAENPYRFSTKELHAQSGLYDFGYRFYSASMGRWINRDPIEEDGGINLYAMVSNNPVNLIDDYGLAPVYQEIYEISAIQVSPDTPNGVPTVRRPQLMPVYTPTNSGRVTGTNTTIYGGTFAERTHVALMVKEIYGTKHGRSYAWRERELKIYLFRGTPLNASDCTGYLGVVNLDLNDKGVLLQTTKGLLPTPLKVILGHEMGHALQWNMDIGKDRMWNVRSHENPLRREFGLPERTVY